MPYRRISVSIWDDAWYVDLSKEAKLLFLYLITSNMCNQAGMYRVSLRKIEFETSIPQKDLPEIFKELSDKVEFYEEDKIVWIKNFPKYQATNKFFLMSAIKSIRDLPEKYLEKWIKYNWDLLTQHLSPEEINDLTSSPEEVTPPQDQNEINEGLDGGLDMVSNGGSNPRLTPVTPPSNGGSNPRLTPVKRGSNPRLTPVKRGSNPSTDNSIQITDNSKQITDNSIQIADNREQITGSNIVSSSNNNKKLSNTRGDKKESSTTKCPCQKIVEIYHEVLPELPKVRALTDLRKRLLQARWKENPDRQNLNWWRNYFEFVRKSGFLMGKSPPRDGRPPFRADFEWLIRPNNMVKVLEGKYHSPEWWNQVSSGKTSSNWALLSQIMEEENA